MFRLNRALCFQGIEIKRISFEFPLIMSLRTQEGGAISVSQYGVCDLVLPGGVAVLLLNDNCTFPVAVEEIWQCCSRDLWSSPKS